MSLSSGHKNTITCRQRQALFLCVHVILHNKFSLYCTNAYICDRCYRDMRGNTRLVTCRFMNRLGVCASMDTHARYVQYQIKKRFKDPAMSDYPQDAFTLVSVDYLDFIHGHAFHINRPTRLSAVPPPSIVRKCTWDDTMQQPLHFLSKNIPFKNVLGSSRKRLHDAMATKLRNA